MGTWRHIGRGTSCGDKMRKAGKKKSVGDIVFYPVKDSM